MIIDNPEELQLYQEFISKLSAEGTPWLPSARKQFINKQRCPFIGTPEIDKAYFLCDGTGSVYDEHGNSVGYFQVGSIIVYRQSDVVELYGQTFKVTEDGPHPKWVAPMMSARGKTYSERLPQIMEYTAVLGMKPTIKALEDFGFTMTAPFRYIKNKTTVLVSPFSWEMWDDDKWAANGDGAQTLINVILGEGGSDGM